MRLEDTALYRRLQALSRDDPEANALFVRVDQAFRKAADMARTVVHVFPEYTLHDEVHLVGVVDLMGRLIPELVFEQLRPLEIASLILSAGLHDVGMAPPAEEVSALHAALRTENLSLEQTNYLRFRGRQSELVKRKESLIRVGSFHEAEQVEGFMLAEYIRQTHGQRTYRMIFEHFSEYCRYADLNFTDALAKVCRSHTEDAAVLETLHPYDLVRRPGERCNWRFIGVVLRLADVLDFDPKRTPATLFRHLGVREPVSVAEWRKHRQIAAWDIAPGRIAFRADCEDPVIEETIRNFLRIIDGELRTARSTLGAMHDQAAPNLAAQYDLQLPAEIDSRQVGPARGMNGPLYKFLDVRFRLDQEAILGILMGLALYGERHLFLRELLQNAVDACRHRRAVAKAAQLPYEPRVTVRLAEDNGTQVLTVDDNGMGMSEEIIEQYFARIGKSYYRSPDFNAERLPKGSFSPVSQFGIGVLSAFMAGDHMRVETLRATANVMGGREESLWVEVADEGSLFWFREGTKATPGTLISVRLTHPTTELLLGPQIHPPPEPDTDFLRLVRTVAHLAPHVEFPIYCEANGEIAEIRGEYSTDPLDHWDSLRFKCSMLDLSAQGPEGLDGRLTFGLLVNAMDQLIWNQPGRGAQRGHDGEFTFAPGWGSGRWYEVTFGSVLETEWVMQDRGGRSGRTEHRVNSYGTFSQDGFRVPHNLFYPQRSGPTAKLPFPCRYDINLSGAFRLPLTADRTRVPSTPEAIAACETLGREITKLMLAAIKPLVRENPEYFRRIGRVHNADPTYLQLLEELL